MSRDSYLPAGGGKLFDSFFMGGFECSTHRLSTGRRLDMIAATRHDELCRQDYARLKTAGMRVARDGVRWHLIENIEHHYEFASVLDMVRAARDEQIQVIWDLMHYGWPDGLDIFRPEFVRRFVRFGKAFASLLRSEGVTKPWLVPINEISFLSWGGGDVGYLNPHAHGRGLELKAQLARAAIEAMEAIWDILPQARFVQLDPLINIHPRTKRKADVTEAEGRRLAQYQAWDMLCGRIWPQLGGAPKYLDVLGANYYCNNQWICDGPTLKAGQPGYRPFQQMLSELHQRYKRPIFISETGTEGEARPHWLRSICRAVQAAQSQGIPVHGICLYPILNHPGWDDERHCPNGLWDYADDAGNRDVCQPLLEEIRRWQQIFESPADGSLFETSRGSSAGKPLRKGAPTYAKPTRLSPAGISPAGSPAWPS